MGKQRKIEISILKPCSEDWDKMTPEGNGRFCNQCNKTIIDFSTFTDKELLDYFTTAKQKICGVYNPTQLNRIISAPQPSDTSIFKKALFGTALAAGVTASTQSQAQTQPDNTTQTTHTTKKTYHMMGEVVATKPDKISGIVKDSKTGKPIYYVTMDLEVEGEVLNITFTDSAGHYTYNLSARCLNKKAEITANAEGYVSEKKEIIIIDSKLEFDFNLTPGINAPMIPMRIMGDTVMMEPIKKQN